MPTLKINLEYKILGTGEPISNQQVTQNYILAAVGSKYQGGLDGQYRRIFARIMVKLDEGVEKKLEEIELETAELDMLKGAFKDCKLPAAMSYNAGLIEDMIEKIK